MIRGATSMDESTRGSAASAAVRPGVRCARDEAVDGARRACASGDDGVAVCGADVDVRGRGREKPYSFRVRWGGVRPRMGKQL